MQNQGQGHTKMHKKEPAREQELMMSSSFPCKTRKLSSINYLFIYTGCPKKKCDPRLSATGGFIFELETKVG